MKFRPCIDIHNGRVKQIVGATLSDEAAYAEENFVADQDASFFARQFADAGLTGGHIILLNPADQPIYMTSRDEALSALKETPGLWQVGGGITPDNADVFLDAGATHVIVTSYVFRNGAIDQERLKKMTAAVGKEHLVLDLSCKRRDGRYFVVTDRWQHETRVAVNEDTLESLAAYCDEFLIHAADAEGKRDGIETPLLTLLGAWHGLPLTYAGGVHDLDDIELIGRSGAGHIDFTVGSALSLYGGDLALSDILRMCD